MMKIAFEGKKNKSTKSINKRSLRKEGVSSILIVSKTMPLKEKTEQRPIALTFKERNRENTSRDNSSKNHENEKNSQFA